MKNFKALMVVAVLAVAMAGCAKLEKVLPKSGGVWKATSATTVEFENGTQVGTSTTPTDSLPTYTFKDDGTMTVTATGMPTEAYNWSTNADGDQILLTEPGNSFAITIEVLEQKGKTQTWFYAIEFDFGSLGTARSEATINVERQ